MKQFYVASLKEAGQHFLLFPPPPFIIDYHKISAGYGFDRGGTDKKIDFDNVK